MIKAKLLAVVGGVASVVGLAVSCVQAQAGILSTTTIGSLIDSILQYFYDYFMVMLDKVLPFILGLGVLAVVVAIGWGIFHLLHRR